MIKTARHRTVYLRRDEKSIFERLVFTRDQICRQDLLVEK